MKWAKSCSCVSPQRCLMMMRDSIDASSGGMPTLRSLDVVWRMVSAIVGKGVVVLGRGCRLDFAGLLDLEQSIYELVNFAV